MAVDALVYLTYISIILLLGIICTLISQKIKIPNILLLILIGIALSRVAIEGQPAIVFPGVFLTSISLLALVMVIFDSASKFKVKEFDKLSLDVLKLAIVFLILNSIFLTIFTRAIFKLSSVFLALLFAFLMSGTDPVAVMTMLGKVKYKVYRLLEIESLLNTPLIVLLPFIILDLMERIRPELLTFSDFFVEIFPFLKDFLLRFVAGIGAGLLVGIIIFKIMKKAYSEILSPLAVITASLLAYIIAENLGGNGVLAVTTMGLFFGNVYVKQKVQLMEFSTLFANFLEIFVFVLVGLTISFLASLNLVFVLKSLLLFFIYLAIRYTAVRISFRNSDFSGKEKVFMALNAQKGIAVAVVAFTLTTFKIVEKTVIKGTELVSYTPLVNVPGVTEILNLILLFMLYSIIISTIAIKLSRYFVGAEAKEK